MQRITIILTKITNRKIRYHSNPQQTLTSRSKEERTKKKCEFTKIRDLKKNESVKQESGNRKLGFEKELIGLQLVGDREGSSKVQSVVERMRLYVR